MFRIFKIVIFAGIFIGPIFQSREIFAQSLENFRNRSQNQLQQKIQVTLNKYCPEGCELISAEVEVKQLEVESDELGFEAVSGVDSTPHYQVQKAIVQVQIDDRIASKEKNRLQKMIENTAQSIASTVEVSWALVQLPRIGYADKDEETLKLKVTKDVTQTVTKIIEEYCPGDCILNKVSVEGEQVTPDMVKTLPMAQVVRDSNLSSSFYVKNILVDLTLDNKINPAEKQKLLDLTRARLSWIEPVEIKTRSLNFPQNSAVKNGSDPYGLDRLRETLKIFRELAGTKEVFTNTTTNDSKQLNAEVNSKSKESILAKELRENSLTETQNKTLESNVNEKNSATSADKKVELYLLGGLFLLVIGALIFILNKKNKQLEARSSAVALSAPADQNYTKSQRPQLLASTYPLDQSNQTPQFPQLTAVSRDQEALLKRQCQYLKDELGQLFLRQPKISKDVFTRILQEEGPFETAKFIHVVGTFVLREFMHDAKMRQELLRLSDVYQKSDFYFTEEETIKILQQLKTRVTASEIRQMVQSDPFEFLKDYEADQITKLIDGETLLIQGFILTQLSGKVRNEVFLQLGQNDKIKIMSELSHVQSIPRDYLDSLAAALKEKSQKMPVLDSEKINGADVLMDLLQQAKFSEQKDLIKELNDKNPQMASGIKARLITSEIVPYLRDGSILELVMGMNRQHLTHFLLGTTDVVRDSIVNRCPRDLVNTWVEEIQAKGLTQVAESDFQTAEASLHGRIAYLIQQGGVNLREINEKIFAADQTSKFQQAPLRKVS